MRKKIFFRFFSVTLFSVLLMFAIGLWAVNSNAKNLIKERLVNEAELACELVDQPSDFDKFSIYYNNDDFRVTIMSVDGDVLFESDTKDKLANHADREEVINAVKGTPRAVVRYSDTFKCNMTYYALKTKLTDGSEIVLRLAVKNSQITPYITYSIPILLVVLVTALIVSLVISNLLSKNIAGKITEVGKSLKSLNEGSYTPIKPTSGEPELYSVLNEINELNASTLNRIRLIEQEHHKLDTVLGNVSQGIIALGKDGDIVFTNKSILSVFREVELVEGKPLNYLIDDTILCEKIAEHIGEGFAFEYVYRDKDLSVVIVNTSKNGLLDDINTIITVTDITYKKDVARQKSDFFANASHELKTPITVVMGLSELLMENRDVTAGAKKQIERIHGEGARMASLISDMLKLSKLELGAEEEVRITVNLKQVTNEVLSELSPELNKKQITVSVEGDGEVTADPKKIFELIQNLCTNAVNYNNVGGTIRVEIVNDGAVTLKITDTGIGIEKEHIPRLCERFYRVDKSRSKKTGGTGLGLAIVKHVCALYDAELSIDSEIGVGTTVSVKFK